MTTETLLIYVAISAGIILVPGPNILLIITNSFKHGPRAGLITVAGTSTAMAIQLAIVILGISSILTLVSEGFQWLRLLGAVYLIYLGLRALLPHQDTPSYPPVVKTHYLFAQGFLVSFLNPKTLLFFSAFLPQFVSPASPALPQLFLLSGIFLGLAIVFDSGYALLSGNLLRRLSTTRQAFTRRLGGVLLILAGVIFGAGQSNKAP